MTKREALKKHWYGPVIIGLGIFGSLYSLDMVPWLPRAVAATKVEVTTGDAAVENRQFEIQKAPILRIENTDSVMTDFVGEQRKFNEKLDRRVVNILSRVPKKEK